MTAETAVPASQAPKKAKIPIGLVAGFLVMIGVLMMPLPRCV